MKKLNVKWVTETMSDNYKNWKKGDVVTIEAQTGTGKTYFITGDSNHKGLIDWIPNYENIVYICNRTNLKRQLKKDLLKKFGLEIPCIIDVDGNKQIDLESLDKLSKIENVVVSSYHALANGELDKIYKGAKKDLSYFDYIICDECHFLLTDASFYNKCYLPFNCLIKERHPHQIKIFISATMHEIRNSIITCFNRTKEQDLSDSKNNIYEYSTGIDYSYLHIKYFKDVKSILQLIKNDKTDEKWLVFITSKALGKYLCEELEKEQIKTTMITAGVKNDEVKNIISEGQFNSKVLITTKAIDNGINIKDPLLKNMVIMAHDQVTFVQEIGRLRFRITHAPDIKLYINTCYKKTFVTKLNKQYKEKTEMIEEFKDIAEFNKKYSHNYEKLPPDIFYLDFDNSWKINHLGYARLLIDKSFAKDMIDLFNIDGEFAFIKEQLRWLGQEHTFNTDNLIEDVVDAEEVVKLKDFLSSYEGKRLYADDEQQTLSNLIIQELTTISTKTDYRTKKLKPLTLEFLLREQLELSYAVSKSKREDRIINEKRIRKSYIVITKIQ